MRSKTFILVLLLSLILLPEILTAQKKREIILGFGGGYSFSLDTTLNDQKIVSREIFFEEEAKLKYSWGMNFQYFLNPSLGFQLEFQHQTANYYHRLEWYEYISDYGFIIPVNYKERPYLESWNINSLSLSIMLAKRYRGWYPYVSAGVGFHFMDADEDLVLNRFRIGPKKSDSLVKLAAGIKYLLRKNINLNIRLFGQTIIRRYGRTPSLDPSPAIGRAKIYYYDMFRSLNKLIRRKEHLIPTYNFFGVDISIEFII